MVSGKSDSYKRLEKRPADAGLFIVFGAGRGIIIAFVLLPGFCRWPGKGWIVATSRMTISAHEAFSTGRVPVGRGR